MLYLAAASESEIFTISIPKHERSIDQPPKRDTSTLFIPRHSHMVTKEIRLAINDLQLFEDVVAILAVFVICNKTLPHVIIHLMYVYKNIAEYTHRIGRQERETHLTVFPACDCSLLRFRRPVLDYRRLSATPTPILRFADHLKTNKHFHTIRKLKQVTFCTP